QRWGIEVYFRVLKGGCRVEEMQLQTAERAKAALALYMIVAWRVLWTLRLGRECPEMACGGVFAEEEWKALYAMAGKEVPHEAPPLGELRRSSPKSAPRASSAAHWGMVRIMG